MAVTAHSRSLLAEIKLPGYTEAVERVRNYMNRADLSAGELADRVGRGRSTINIFIQGRYKQIGDWRYMAARLLAYIERNPIEPRRHAPGRLFHTENYRLIRKYFLRAADQGEVCLLYGPPGTQKTFVLEQLIIERNLAGKNDAFYAYASAEMAAGALLKRIGREAGALIRVWGVERLVANLLARISRMPKPPALVVDEAQHLDVHCLELLRELHDRSGCGLVLAGSHNLLDNFLRGRAQLEQWLSRIDHKDPLPGLVEDEVEKIAARELSNGQPAKLSEKQLKALVRACKTEDIFARDASGKSAPRTYLSVRRLVKNLAQYKEAAA